MKEQNKKKEDLYRALRLIGEIITEEKPKIEKDKKMSHSTKSKLEKAQKLLKNITESDNSNSSK